MRQLELLCLVAGLALVITLPAARAAFAQGTTGAAVSGREEYVNSCGACHGPDGRGDGVIAGYLKNKPADLTALARKNGGQFPEKKLAAFIDGTQMIGPHGAREMPVWGREFLSEGSTPEEATARVDALVEYLKSIQEK